MKTTRHPAPADQTDILRINAAALPGVAPLDALELHRLMALPNRHLVVEEESESRAVVGYALAFPSTAPYDGEEFLTFQRTLSRPFVYIDQIAIQPTARRTRLGSTLYDVLERDARIEAISALCCEVNLDPPNPGSMAFHQRSGFSIIGELHTADDRTVALLIKTLK